MKLPGAAAARALSPARSVGSTGFGGSAMAFASAP